MAGCWGSSHTNIAPSLRLADGTWNGVLFLATGLSHALETEMDRALAIASLSARGFAALYEIHTQSPTSQRDLARRLGLEPSTTSELLRRLESKGWIARPGPERRRGAGPALVLTPAGQAALAKAERVATQVEKRWARRLGRTAGSGLEEARYQGLRRWLREARAALADGAGAGSPAIASSANRRASCGRPRAHWGG